MSPKDEQECCVRLSNCKLAVSIRDRMPATAVRNNKNVGGRIQPGFSTVLILKGLVPISRNFRFNIILKRRYDGDQLLGTRILLENIESSLSILSSYQVNASSSKGMQRCLFGSLSLSENRYVVKMTSVFFKIEFRFRFRRERCQNLAAGCQRQPLQESSPLRIERQFF